MARIEPVNVDIEVHVSSPFTPWRIAGAAILGCAAVAVSVLAGAPSWVQAVAAVPLATVGIAWAYVHVRMWWAWQSIMRALSEPTVTVSYERAAVVGPRGEKGDKPCTD